MNRYRRFVLRRGAEEAQDVVVEALHDGRHRVGRAGRSEDVEARRLPDGRLSVLFDDGRQVCGRALPRGKGVVEISTNRGSVRLSLADPLSDRIAHAAAETGGEEKEEEIRALMPGRVLEVCIAPGDWVEAGCLLLVIEAMKMQNEIRATARGAVVGVSVSPGEAVESGASLLTLGSRPTV